MNALKLLRSLRMVDGKVIRRPKVDLSARPEMTVEIVRMKHRTPLGIDCLRWFVEMCDDVPVDAHDQGFETPEKAAEWCAQRNYKILAVIK